MPKAFGFFLIVFIFLLVTKSSYADSDIKINEISPHPSSGNKEWVEFYNPESVDLSSYVLDDDTNFGDDTGSTAKKSLSAYDNSTYPYPTFEFGSFLNNGGDYVVLFSQDGAIIDQYQYSEDPGSDVSIGRSPDGFGDFTILSSQTKGFQNSNPQPSPSPSPSSTSQSSSSTSSKSKSPSPSPKNSPSPSSSKKTSSVLGSSKSAEITKSPATEINLSVSPSPAAEETVQQSSKKLKIAGSVAGSGAIIMGISVGLYLWYKRKLSKGNEDKGPI